MERPSDAQGPLRRPVGGTEQGSAAGAGPAASLPRLSGRKNLWRIMRRERFKTATTSPTASIFSLGLWPNIPGCGRWWTVGSISFFPRIWRRRDFLRPIETFRAVLRGGLGWGLPADLDIAHGLWVKWGCDVGP